MDEVSFILLILLATIFVLFIKFLYQLYKDRGQLSVVVRGLKNEETLRVRLRFCVAGF